MFYVPLQIKFSSPKSHENELRRTVASRVRSGPMKLQLLLRMERRASAERRLQGRSVRLPLAAARRRDGGAAALVVDSWCVNAGLCAEVCVFRLIMRIFTSINSCAKYEGMILPHILRTSLFGSKQLAWETQGKSIESAERHLKEQIIFTLLLVKLNLCYHWVVLNPSFKTWFGEICTELRGLQFFF